MNKRILIVAALAVVVLVGSVVGGVALAAGPNQGAASSGQRLFGIVEDGMISMPPDDGLPYYMFLGNIVITNPDLRNSKTITSIVISDGSDGSVVKTIVPSGEEALLRSQEVFETDFEMLDIHPSERHWYTVNVYWTGQGTQLIGYTSPAYLKVEQDEAGQWHCVGFEGSAPIQMQYYAK